jgi:hypothetical protein
MFTDAIKQKANRCGAAEDAIPELNYVRPRKEQRAPLLEHFQKSLSSSFVGGQGP